ncbi:MAG: hypothetical protein IT379_42050 [Deltaproteobacteria bacterium]|nr:hypothetical protein [Deltaproteobacteria bacterium]
MIDTLELACADETNGRFVETTPPESPTPAPGCGRKGALAVFVANCMGYRFLSFAETVVPMELYADGLIRPQPIGEDPDPPTESPQFVLPVPTASDAASLAIISAAYFQAAGFAGAVALDLTDIDCSGSQALNAHSVETAPDDDPAADYVTLGFVIASGVSEAGRMIGEAAGVASQNLQAAAEAQRATQRDERQAIIGGWRGRHDSRLEIANILFGIPEDLFEAEGVPSDTLLARAPAVETPAETDADRRAEELVRSLRIDPRLEESQLYEQVCGAMQEDLPGIFEESANCDTEAESLLTGFGIDLVGLRQATRRILQTSAATGRVLMDDPSTPLGGIPRVVGTLPNAAPADPAFLFARTAGATRLSDVADTDADVHAPTPEYALRGVLNTQDYLAWVLERAIRRADYTADSAATSIAERGRLLLRESVPMRVSVAIGQADEPTCSPYCPPNTRIAGLHLPGGQWLPPDDPQTPETAERGYRFPGRTFGLGGDIDRVRVRLYGGVADVDRYELVRGEAGVQCVLGGRIEGVPCDPSDYLLGAPTLQTDSSAASGFGTKYLEWNWMGGGGDEPAAQEGESMYIVDSLGDTLGHQGVVLGFIAHEGDHNGMDDQHSRLTGFPAGVTVRTSVTETIAPDPVDLERAQYTCAGVLHDVRLPLEDELTESTEGRDEIESAWAHYLRLARQAADEADVLGEELVREGLEMDLRAENARDALESICGGVVNVASLDANPATCTCAMGAAECERAEIATGPSDCGRCVLDRCLPGGLTQLLRDSPDLDSVRRCLGEPRDGEVELVHAALSDHPLCMWQVTERNQPPCVCPVGAAECPDPVEFECPMIASPDASSCSTVYGSSLPAGFTALAPSRAIGLTATGSSGAFAGSCAQIARLRARWPIGSGSPVPADAAQLLEDVLTQEALDWPAFQDLASVIQFRQEMFGFASVTVGGSTWATTGTRRLGRTPDGTFPCGPVIEENMELDSLYTRVCTGGPRFGYSLLCGFGNTCQGTALDGVNQRMQRAVELLRALGGQLPRYGAEIDNPSNDLPLDVDDRRLVSQVQVPQWLRDDPRLCAGGNCFDGTIQTWNFRNPGSSDFPFTAECVDVTSPQEIPPSLEEVFSECDFDAPEPVRRYYRTFSAAIFDEGFDAAVWSPRSGAVDVNLAALGGGVAPTAAMGLARYDYHQLLDALELACLIRQDAAGGCGADLTELPEVRSAQDFPKLRRMLQCAADRFERSLTRLALVDIPVALADDLRSSAISSTFPSYRGQYGQAVAGLRGALEDVVSATRQVATNIRDFGGDLEIARGELREIQLESQIREVQLMADISGQIARCAASGTEVQNVYTFGGASAITCMDAAMQILASTLIAGLRADISDVNTSEVFTRVAMLVSSRMDSLGNATRLLSQAYSQAQSFLAQLEQHRSAARRAASEVLLLDRDDAGREYAVNPVLRARMSTTQVRYARARATALRYTYLARKAIEQRLGVEMSRMSREMTLVEAPSTWADSLCGMPAINYDRLRDADLNVGSFEGSFIGDYVRRLEAFVESYRIDYPFQDGADTAVVSLRDELLRVRATCDTQGPNLLLESLGVGAEPDFGNWVPTCLDETGPCATATHASLSPFRCEAVAPTGTEVPACAERTLGDARAVEIITPRNPGTTAWTQTVSVTPGLYMLSWYERINAPTTDDEPVSDTENLACRDDVMGLGAEVPRIDPTVSVSGDATAEATDYSFVPLDSANNAAVERWIDACRWRRAKTLIEITGDPADTSAAVDLTVNLIVTPLASEDDPRVLFAAPQLERLETWQVEPTVPVPQPFFPTDDDLLFRVGLCEDTTGTVFRGGRYWRRGCDYLCPDGLGQTCAAASVGDRAAQRCYWETDFGISLTDIERGELIPSGNFALGNFNYRFDTFGVNLVGVGLQDCSRAATPTECYANASIPFSLVHSPPYRTRNHEGEVVEASLFTGHIEHARSLAAERYLTNPLSGADRSLLQDYMRRELRGRPLDGHYTLRVWEAPGFDWNRLEDIQLILNYRYWTRFE